MTRTSIPRSVFLWALLAHLATASFALRPFEPLDLFDLEYASDPQIAPDGESVIYVRVGMDVMTDRERRSLWRVSTDGRTHRPLATAGENPSSPRWSPSGDRLLYIASDSSGKRQLFLYYFDSRESAAISHLQEAPSSVTWSPDGSQIGFTMFVDHEPPSFAEMPTKPEGANWAPAAKVIEDLVYRSDGDGFLPLGNRQIFVIPADSGTPRQLTSGPFNHDAPRFLPGGVKILFSANRKKDWQYEPSDSEVFVLGLDSAEPLALTDRHGPDQSPIPSPDGEWMVYSGYDEEYFGYQVTRLWLAKTDGTEQQPLTADLDRSPQSPIWDKGSKRIFFQFNEHGNGKIASVGLDGKVERLASDLGGLSLGRPYSGGSFTVSDSRLHDGPPVLAFTYSRPDHPADVAIVRAGESMVRLTDLNQDLSRTIEWSQVEEIWFESSHDQQRIQGWIAKPPGFDPAQKYPLMLEIHGGPFADYGDRFAAEIQLYAAAGYVVLYTNPRGSTSYGQDFGNLIHHSYPGNDYHDLISGVDAVIDLGYVDPERLYVTGGSGGGVLTSWIVSHTHRFAAAAVQKPVINWYSWVLTADIATTYKYWFPSLPWENLQHYMDRSPIHHVGKVETPTLLITGEVDYRTPMSESEQFYQALKLRKVDAALVRIPEASHGIAARPSHLLSKVQHILAWFERYGSMRYE